MLPCRRDRWQLAALTYLQKRCLPELPEPCLGINFARDGMARKDWLALVAVHSDSWLYAVAFYYGAKLDASSRYGLMQLVHCAALGG